MWPETEKKKPQCDTDGYTMWQTSMAQAGEAGPADKPLPDTPSPPTGDTSPH